MAGQDDVDDPVSLPYIFETGANVEGSASYGSLGLGTKNGATEFIQRYSDNTGENLPGTESELSAIAPNTGGIQIPADMSTGDAFSVDFDLSEVPRL